MDTSNGVWSLGINQISFVCVNIQLHCRKILAVQGTLRHIIISQIEILKMFVTYLCRECV